MATKKITELNTLTGAGVANGDLLPIVDIGTPNETKAITADQLAQMPQLSSRYAPLNDQIITIPAGAMVATSGSPTLGGGGDGGRWNSWAMDASTTEVATFGIAFPDWWNTVNVDLWWTNGGAGAGDVRWSVLFDRAGEGDTLSTGRGYSVGVVTATAGLLDVMVKTRTTTGAAIDHTKFINCRIQRLGLDAADTLANDCFLFGAVISRAS